MCGSNTVLGRVVTSVSDVVKQTGSDIKQVVTNPGKANFGQFAGALLPVAGPTIQNDIKHPADIAGQLAILGAVAGGAGLIGAGTAAPLAPGAGVLAPVTAPIDTAAASLGDLTSYVPTAAETGDLGGAGVLAPTIDASVGTAPLTSLPTLFNENALAPSLTGGLPAGAGVETPSFAATDAGVAASGAPAGTLASGGAGWVQTIATAESAILAPLALLKTILPPQLAKLLPSGASTGSTIDVSTPGINGGGLFGPGGLLGNLFGGSQGSIGTGGAGTVGIPIKSSVSPLVIIAIIAGAFLLIKKRRIV